MRYKLIRGLERDLWNVLTVGDWYFIVSIQQYLREGTSGYNYVIVEKSMAFTELELSVYFKSLREFNLEKILA